MGRWDKLTEQQSQFLLRLATLSLKTEVESFCHGWDGSQSDLRPMVGKVNRDTILEHIPGEVVFYQSLEKLGFICLNVLHRTGDSLSIDRQEFSLAVYKPVFEYAGYHRKCGVARRWADFWYDFSRGETAVSRLLWMLISALLGLAVGYALR